MNGIPRAKSLGTSRCISFPIQKLIQASAVTGQMHSCWGIPDPLLPKHMENHPKEPKNILRTIFLCDWDLYLWLPDTRKLGKQGDNSYNSGSWKTGDALLYYYALRLFLKGWKSSRIKERREREGRKRKDSTFTLLICLVEQHAYILMRL